MRSHALPRSNCRARGSAESQRQGGRRDRQAGLATSFWLTQHGVEHQVLERRDALGGARQDRWDSFYLNTPNFSFMLPRLTYDGPEPDAFPPRRRH